MPPKLSPEQIASIQKRADVATLGEWYVSSPSMTYQSVYSTTKAGDGRDTNICDVKTGTAAQKPRAPGNLAFIANARQDIPALLSHASALEEELRAAREANDHLERQLKRFKMHGAQLSPEEAEQVRQQLGNDMPIRSDDSNLSREGGGEQGIEWSEDATGVCAATLGELEATAYGSVGGGFVAIVRGPDKGIFTTTGISSIDLARRICELVLRSFVPSTPATKGAE